jgi:hypothetical protein
MCWDQCINVRVDRRHCGACGHTCTTLQECVDGVCARSDPPDDGCSAQSLRLWINAFYPGVVDEFTRERVIDGRLESVAGPRRGETAQSCSSTHACLRTNRRPNADEDQTWESFFFRDPAAPSLAHAALEIDLRDRREIRAVIPLPDPEYGLLQHFEDITGPGRIPSAVERCRIPISGASRWFHDFDADSIDGGLRFNVRATCQAWDDLQCLEPGGEPGACAVLDQFAVCPLGSIQGSMAVQVLPDEGMVRVTILDLEVPRYPVVEIYAALDDGNVQRVWASTAPPAPLAALGTTDPEQIGEVTIDLPCGCGPCDAGETTCEDDETCVSDAYFILSSSQHLRLNEVALGQAPDAGINADGPVTVTKNGITPVYSGQGAGAESRTPPIGFSGKRGDRLRIRIACPGGAATCPGALAGPLFLHRIDSLFGPRSVQQLIPGRVPLPLGDTLQRHVVELSRVTKPRAASASPSGRG